MISMHNFRLGYYSLLFPNFVYLKKKRKRKKMQYVGICVSAMCYVLFTQYTVIKCQRINKNSAVAHVSASFP